MANKIKVALHNLGGELESKTVEPKDVVRAIEEMLGDTTDLEGGYTIHLTDPEETDE